MSYPSTMHNHRHVICKAIVLGPSRQPFHLLNLICTSITCRMTNNHNSPHSYDKPQTCSTASVSAQYPPASLPWLVRTARKLLQVTGLYTAAQVRFCCPLGSGMLVRATTDFAKMRSWPRANLMSISRGRIPAELAPGPMNARTQSGPLTPDCLRSRWMFWKPRV